MKKSILACVLLAGFATPSLAADLALRGALPAAPVVEGDYNWTGTYAGVHAGYGRGRSTAIEKATMDADPTMCAPAGTPGVPAGMYWCNVNGAPNYTPTPQPSFNTIGDKWSGKIKGALAGVTLGYNKQFGNWVIGGELDWGYLGLKGESGPSPASKDDTSIVTRATDYSMARMRLGYAFNRLLVFGSAGAVLGRFNSYVQDPDMPIGIRTAQTSTQLGWVVGIGAEYAATNNISVKAEMLSMGFAPNLSSGYVNVTCTPACPPQWKMDRLGMAFDGNAAWNIRQAVTLGRVGVNYKF